MDSFRVSITVSSAGLPTIYQRLSVLPEGKARAELLRTMLSFYELWASGTTMPGTVVVGSQQHTSEPSVKLGSSQPSTDTVPSSKSQNEEPILAGDEMSESDFQSLKEDFAGFAD